MGGWVLVTLGFERPENQIDTAETGLSQVEISSLLVELGAGKVECKNELEEFECLHGFERVETENGCCGGQTEPVSLGVFPLGGRKGE